MLLSLAWSSLLVGLMWNYANGVLLSAPNIFLLIGWALTLAYACFELLTGNDTYGTFVMPIVVIALVIGWFSSALPNGNETSALLVYQQWPMLVAHVGAFIVAAVFFLIGGVASVMLLRQAHQLKRDKKAALAQVGPSLASLQRVATRSVAIGLPILTVGLLLGISQGWATGQLTLSDTTAFFSVRIIVSCLLWSCYVLYLVMTYIINSSWRVASCVSIVGSVGTLVIVVLSAVLPMLGA
ncbi:MAG: cytochrome c biogenesis protein CcsA [Coriobacteriales bacterium]|nr:cytochrome c biogenesis protein CcsA [Coriobacteriales bacterium]